MHTSNGDEGHYEMGRVGGNKMRESGGEDVGSVPKCATAFVYELQFLQAQLMFFIWREDAERRRVEEKQSEPCKFPVKGNSAGVVAGGRPSSNCPKLFVNGINFQHHSITNVN